MIQEMANRKPKDVTIKMKDLRNIDTLVEIPSWMTSMSEPSLLTILNTNYNKICIHRSPVFLESKNSMSLLTKLL